MFSYLSIRSSHLLDLEKIKKHGLDFPFTVSSLSISFDTSERNLNLISLLGIKPMQVFKPILNVNVIVVYTLEW